MWPKTISQSSSSARLPSNIASVSVGKPAMMSAPIAISGRCCFDPLNQRNRFRTAVAALHPLEDHVIARLKRQMQMRHQARLRW